LTTTLQWTVDLLEDEAQQFVLKLTAQPETTG